MNQKLILKKNIYGLIVNLQRVLNFTNQKRMTYPYRVFGFCVLNNPLKSGVNYGTFFGETDQNIKLRGECTVQRAKWYQR